MVGDFIVGIDRIIASACLDHRDVAGGGAPAATGGEDAVKKTSKKLSKKGEGEAGVVVVECRICQEEGGEAEMESPCACSGTLKFAHRKCIQKWCNKKGNITCEICSQIYVPNYSVPPTRSATDLMGMDIRRSWGTRIGLRDSHFLAIAVAEQELLQDEYEEYAASTTTGAACCHIIAFTVMLLLLVHHLFVVTKDLSMLQGVSALFNVSLQLAGFFLPCYVIAQSCYIIQSRRRRQV